MGWAEGLQSGMQLGNLINQGFDRRALAEEAAKHKVTGLEVDRAPVEDVITQRDAAAQELIGNGMSSDQAYQQATQQFLPQLQENARTVGLAPQYAYGDQTFTNRQEAEQAMALGRTQGMANVYRGLGDEEKASALEARALQNRAAGLTVKGQERAEQDAQRLQGFEADYSQLENPNDTNAIRALAAKHQLSRKQQFDVASQITGIAKNELEALDLDIERSTKGKSYTQLLDMHKNDKRFDDGFHFIEGKGANGAIVLHKVSDADPKTILSSQTFKDPDLATAYLRKSASDPANIAEWKLGIDKAQAAIEASKSTTNLHNAEAGLIPAKKGLLTAQAALLSSKPETVATAQENKLYTELTKTSAWQAAERKGDSSAMNALMVGRGLDPAKHGGQQGLEGFKPRTPAKAEGVDTKAKAAPAAETKPAKPSEKELNARVDYASYQEKARAAQEKARADRALRAEQEALAAQQADELAARRRAELANNFNRQYGLTRP